MWRKRWKQLFKEIAFLFTWKTEKEINGKAAMRKFIKGAGNKLYLSFYIKILTRWHSEKRRPHVQ